MQLSLVLWSVWGVVVLSFIVMKIYVMGLSRDEDDQLVLQDGLSHVKDEQAVILTKLHRIEPIQRTLLWLVIGMSLVMVGYYVFDMISQFK
jgi:hypothetical protein